MTALSCGGGKPVIHPRTRGSLSAEFGSVAGVRIVIRSIL